MRLVTSIAWLCGAAALAAGPALTTVQDSIYKADGSRFQGVAVISWNSFLAADGSNVAPNSIAVPIVNGNLKVQLVPTTNVAGGANYEVRYTSDGRVHFEEIWAVPPSTRTVRLREVRAATSSGGGTTPPASGTVIQEADVVGLVADLLARPVRGGAFNSSRVAFINQAGGIDAVTGAAQDCVRANGLTAECAPRFIDGETPQGAVNGTNAVFQLTSAPDPVASLLLFRNGVLQKQGLDYQLNGQAVTFQPGAVPQAGDVLLANYRARQL